MLLQTAVSRLLRIFDVTHAVLLHLSSIRVFSVMRKVLT